METTPILETLTRKQPQSMAANTRNKQSLEKREVLYPPVILCCTLSEDQLSSAAIDLLAISISHSLIVLLIYYKVKLQPRNCRLYRNKISKVTAGAEVNARLVP